MASGAEALQGPSLLQFRWVRQLVLILSLSAAIAVGIAVAFWIREPNYVPLFNELSERDSAAVSEALRSAKVDFKIDPSSGVVMVPGTQARDVRVQLAAQGLPQSARQGFEMLNQEQSMGTSQFIEAARYRHALEEELARSIASVRGIESARVHLALPKQSVFIRNRSDATASVLVKLFPGRILDPSQVNAIVHMVASSVPNLEVGKVSLVDQQGRLLSDPDDGQPLAISAKQLDYTRALEEDLRQRVVHLLEPIVGVGKVRAEINASLDFTQLESTQESYSPDGRVIRSEQVNQQRSLGDTPVAGVPGALSNQPPGAGTTNPTAATTGNPAIPSSENRSETRNFEVDRVVSHTRRPTGSMVRMSAAIIIDERVRLDNRGVAQANPYSADEITRFTELVKQALGFDAVRGDTINLVASSFSQPEIVELPELPIWEQPWVLDLGKQVLGGLFILALMLYFVKPMIRTLNTPLQLIAPPSSGNDGSADRVGSNGQIIHQTNSYDQKMDVARALVKEQPDRVANVVKGWVKADG